MLAVIQPGTFRQTDQGNQYLVIAMGYSTPWQVYADPIQEAPKVTEYLESFTATWSLT
jgi:hypothetical protein